MASKLKFSHSLLCEHVVAGGGNKHTLINVFPGDVLVAAFPAELVFGFYSEHLPTVLGGMKISILVGERAIAHLDVAVAPSFPGASGIIAIPAFPVHCEGETSIEFIAKMEGSAPTTMLKKRILLAGGPNDPTVSRPPS